MSVFAIMWFRLLIAVVSLIFCLLAVGRHTGIFNIKEWVLWEKHDGSYYAPTSQLSVT